MLSSYNSEQGERGIILSLPCSGLLLARLFVLVTPKLSNYYFTSKYSPPFLSYNPIFHRWQHLYQALMWAIVVVTIVYNKKKIFFCGKVYIVMYFFVSIRFHIRYFLDLPLSMCSYEKSFYEKSVKVSSFC